jgi:hypothetical protein
MRGSLLVPRTNLINKKPSHPGANARATVRSLERAQPARIRVMLIEHPPFSGRALTSRLKLRMNELFM